MLVEGSGPVRRFDVAVGRVHVEIDRVRQRKRQRTHRRPCDRPARADSCTDRSECHRRRAPVLFGRPLQAVRHAAPRLIGHGAVAGSVSPDTERQVGQLGQSALRRTQHAGFADLVGAQIVALQIERAAARVLIEAGVLRAEAARIDAADRLHVFPFAADHEVARGRRRRTGRRPPPRACLSPSWCMDCWKSMSMRAPSIFVLRKMFCTPAIAPEPYAAEAPPVTVST